MTRRVVITGMGVVTPLAIDVPAYWDRLLNGKSGVGLIEQIDTTEFKVKFGGEVKNWAPEKFFDSKACRRMDRFAQFAMVATLEAWKQAASTFQRRSFRVGAIVGSGIAADGIRRQHQVHARRRSAASAVCYPK